MNLLSMQDKLDELYKKELNKENLKKDFNEITCKISAPFLLNVSQDYFDSKKRILYVGKETNEWWGKLKNFIDLDDSIDILKERYTAEFSGGEVTYSKDPRKKIVYGEEDWKNSQFFNKYKYIRKNIDGCLLWSELLKMDSGEKGYSRNSNHISQIVEYSKKLFFKELNILKPHAIIFVTATAKNTKEYDDIIKSILQGYKTIDVIEPGKLWIFEYNGIKCYRTLHPQSYHFRKVKKNDYYKMITEDIKNDFLLFKK